MKYLICVFWCVAISVGLSAQSPVINGDSLRQTGNLSAAIEAYTSTYWHTPSDVRNTYNLACSYALTYQVDSAFHYLMLATKHDSSLTVLADCDLLSLRDDERWLWVEQQQFKKFQHKTKQSIQSIDYARKLLRLIVSDQALDYQVDQAKAYFVENGRLPHWYYPLGWVKQQMTQQNYTELCALLEQYGWPKYTEVGTLAADAPLLIINHQHDSALREYYLPMIQAACLEGEGSCLEYAKIQDRILVENGEKQRYGMQFRYRSDRTLEPFPIADPHRVDQRRKEIGLEPLKDYLMRKINYEWAVAQEGEATKE